QRIGQGRENAKQYFLDHPELRAEVEQQVRAAYGFGEYVPAEKNTASNDDVTESEEIELLED
ncbi:MAG: DNA recombination/repair protein RecA, partial [Desemzia incerta]